MTIYPALLMAYLLGAILIGLLVIMNSPVIGRIFTEQPGWHGIGLFSHGSQDGYDPQVENATGWWFQTCFIFHNIWDNPSY